MAVMGSPLRPENAEQDDHHDHHGDGANHADGGGEALPPQPQLEGLVVHEDGLTAGFGAEISAVIADEAFCFLDAPVRRLATPDIPIPYNIHLMEAALPTAQSISKEIRELLEF